MRLDKLELFGFKSFPTKTELIFGEGITAIVGPNGCGKTNIADAIRWVLGEQNVRLLRGEEMKDVIFNGSLNTKPLGMAEVSLTFTNTRGTLPIEYTEITITRRLFRSGESEYFINKNPCRLKDIRELFMDTGMGSHTYSLIQQNMVESVLSDKPEERRFLFEQAAGITKYKSRRDSAIRKLEATESDLLRVSDVLQEVEKQVKSLEKQVKKASAYKRYTKKLKELDVTLNYREYIRLKTENEPLLIKITELQNKRDELSAIVSTKEAEAEEISKMVIDKEHELTKMSDEIKSLNKKIQTLEEDILVSKERNQHLNDKLKNLYNESFELKERIKNLQSERNTLEENIKNISSSVNRVKELYIEKEKIFKDFEKQWNEKNKEIQELQRKKLTLSENKASKISVLNNLNNKLSVISYRQNELNVEATEVLNKITKSKEEHKLLEDELYQKENQINELEKEEKSYNAELEDLRKKFEAVNSKHQELKEMLFKRQANLNILQRLVSEFEDYEDGIKSLFAEGKKWQGLSGVVGDKIISVPQYEIAIASALGERMQQILADNFESAYQAIEYLYSQNKGFSSFLLLDWLCNSDEYQVSSVKPQIPDDLMTNDGILGRAIDFVKFEEKYRNVMNFLLGNIIIVKDINIAKELIEKLKGKNIVLVTLRGDVIDLRGVVHGGNSKGESASNILSRNREIKTLKNEITDIELDISNIEEEKSNYILRIDKINSNLSDIRKKLQELRNEVILCDRKSTQLDFEIKRFNERLDKIKFESTELSKQKDEIESKIPDIERQIKEDEESDKSIMIDIERFNEELSNMSSKRDALSEEMHKARSSLVEEEGKERYILKELERNKNLESELLKTLENKEKSIEELKNDISILSENIEEKSKEYKMLDSIRVEKESLINSLESEHYELLQQAKEKDNSAKSSRKELSSIYESLSELEIKSAQFSAQKDSIKQKILEEYDVDLDTVSDEILQAVIEKDDYDDDEKGEYSNSKTQDSNEEQNKQDMGNNAEEQVPGIQHPTSSTQTSNSKLSTLNSLTSDELREQIAKYKKRIENLGAVNLMAVDEYEKENERYNFLKNQHDDLSKAKDSLLKTITEINQEARRLLSETFHIARRNFVETFIQLFEGGEADLIWDEKVDPLEANIEIVAKPRGKKLQSIELMSGGEKALVAIAMLFALYMIKPSPFCILDEIDAPLDDANIDRFIKLLKRFSENSQFIIITHNKKTMGIADYLYGVTMEEAGVSKLVSVRFAESKKQLEAFEP